MYEHYVPRSAPLPSHRRPRVHFDDPSPHGFDSIARPVRFGHYPACTFGTQYGRRRSPLDFEAHTATPPPRNAGRTRRSSSPLTTRCDYAYFRDGMHQSPPPLLVHRGNVRHYEYGLPTQVTHAVWRDVYLDGSSKYNTEVTLETNFDESDRRRNTKRHPYQWRYLHGDINTQRRRVVERTPFKDVSRASSTELERLISRQKDDERQIVLLEEQLKRCRQNVKIGNREKRPSQVIIPTLTG